MAERRIDQIVDTATELASGDLTVVRKSGGPTAKISHPNEVVRKGVLNTLVTSQVVPGSDTLAMWDATDDLMKEVLVEDILFGNFGNTSRDANFTLNEATSIKAQELVDSVSSITLNGNEANVGGADFMLCNFRSVDVTVTASNITMYVAGVASATATIRARRSASITVSNDRTEAIFSGG